MKDRIILYTTHCPKCRVIELKLKQKNIDFEIIDDLDKVVEFGKLHNITSAPILQVNDTVYTFTDAVKYINGVK